MNAQILKQSLKHVLPAGCRRLIHVLRHLNAYHWLRKDQLTYAQDFLYTYHSAEFMRERRFVEAYNIGKALDAGFYLRNSFDIHWRAHVLCWAATLATHLEGDFVECGVWAGTYAGVVMHYVDFQNIPKKYYLLDTFSGLDPRYSSKAEMQR